MLIREVGVVVGGVTPSTPMGSRVVVMGVVTSTLVMGVEVVVVVVSPPKVVVPTQVESIQVRGHIPRVIGGHRPLWE